MTLSGIDLMRRYVIGDIHGCSKALGTLLDEILPSPDDTLIFLGDFIDRGPDSRGVLKQMVELGRHTQMIALRGNHEIMLLGILFGGLDPELWFRCGGEATLANYGGKLSGIPDSHIQFLQSLRPHYEAENEFFIHAGYHPMQPIEETEDAVRYWNHPAFWPGPHVNGKRAYVGHSPQISGNVLDIGHLACVDTYCFGGGWLTAMDVDTDEILQASLQGHLRKAPLQSMFKWLKQLYRPGDSRMSH